MLIVSGVSGVGKSSLLQAGVIPQRGRAGLQDAPGGAPWPCLVMTPTAAPLDELAMRTAGLVGASAAVLRSEFEAIPERFALSAREAAGDGADARQRRLLLVVDQFEQLFTRCSNERERQAFITALHSAATTCSGREQIPPALVVLVVRADFEGRCTEYPELTEAVKGRYLLTSMTEVELRLAITEPARRAGASVDDALVEELVRHARQSSAPVARRRGIVDGAGALPLLSYALDQAWRSRVQDVLGLGDYVRAGGMGSIAASAEDAYAELSPLQQTAAQQIFMRMTTTSADGTVSSSRVTRSELLAGTAASDVDAVLEAFADEKVRLLTLGPDSVEISHEILLTAWRRLAGWLEGDVDDRVRYSRLVIDAQTWDDNGRAASYLYPAGRLAEVEASAARWASVPGRYPPLDDITAAFVGGARQAMRTRRRRWRAGVAALSVLTLGAGTAVGAAVSYRGNADQQHAIALSQELAAGSISLGIADPVVAGQYAAAAWQVSPTSQAQSAMMTLLAEQQQDGVLPAGGDSFGTEKTGVAFSPSGRVVATWGGDLKLWDVATRTLLAERSDAATGNYYGGAISDATFSADGKLLATADGEYARLRNPATGKTIGQLLPADPSDPAAGTFVQAVALSPDGRVLASADSDGYIRLWDTATDKPFGRPLPVQPQSDSSGLGGVPAVAFSPDGTILASASGIYVQLWNTITGARIGKPLRAATSGSGTGVVAVAFSPDGQLLASASTDGYVRLWHTPTGAMYGKQLPANAGTSGSANGVAFSPNGRYLVTSGNEGSIRLWDIAAGTLVADPLPSITTTSGSGTIAYSPDGEILATASDEGAVRLWNTATWRPLGAPLPGASPGNSTTGVAFSPNGTLLADAGSDGYIRLWDTVTGSPVAKPLPADPGNADGVLTLAFSPNGKILASADGDGYVRLWDPANGSPVGKPLFAAARSTDGPSIAVFSPDDKMLAVSQPYGLVQVWNTASGKPVGKPLPVNPGQYGIVEAAAFSPRGGLLATLDGYGSVGLWSVSTGKRIRTFTSKEGATHIAFSPDGSLLAIAGPTDNLQIWDISTGTVITLATSTPEEDVLPLYITGIAFSPDGRLIASTDSNGQLQLWNTSTGTSAGLPLAIESSADSLTFSPDGTTLATAEENGVVQLWQTRFLSDPYSALCSEVGQPDWNVGSMAALRAVTCVS